MQNVLTTQDLLAILEIINLAATRNAFRVEEFLGVGSVYTKLTSVVEQSLAQQNSAEQSPNSQEKETTND